ncbi:MAG: hypothetical protein ACE5EA_11520 [Nitrospirota bacterium]
MIKGLHPALNTAIRSLVSAYDGEESGQSEEVCVRIEGLVAYYPFNGNANNESGNWNKGRCLGLL